MTTIAYRDGVLATDSMVVAAGGEEDGFRCSDVVKARSYRNGEWLVGAAGDTLLFEHVFDEIEQHLGDGALEFSTLGDFSDYVTPDASEGNARESLELLLAHPASGRTWFAALTTSGMLMAYEVKGPYHAIGSGAGYALVAMDCGLCAEQAVKAACRRSIQSGQPVVVHGVRR